MAQLAPLLGGTSERRVCCVLHFIGRPMNAITVHVDRALHQLLRQVRLGALVAAQLLAPCPTVLTMLVRVALLGAIPLARPGRAQRHAQQLAHALGHGEGPNVLPAEKRLCKQGLNHTRARE